MKAQLMIAATAGAACGLPVNHRHRWNPRERDMDAFQLDMHHWRCALNEKNWSVLDPVDWIAHDKFNLADGFEADIFKVEEILFKGDPVIKVEQEMDRQRAVEGRKNRKVLLN